MKLSIIVEDGSVIKDGEGLTALTLINIPNTIRALQWNGSSGHIEYVNQTEESISKLPQWALDAEQALETARYVAPLTPEEIEARAISIATAQAKVERDLLVSKIIVTTTSGKDFDGDETSQGRMARAVTSSEIGDTTMWILANNVPTFVTHGELKEALRLAGEAQTDIWMQQ